MRLFKKRKKKTVVFAEYKDRVMTIKYSDDSEEQYQGGTTVWYKMPYMQRQDTMMEYWLSQIYEYITYWGGTFPDAHLKQQSKIEDK